jgi:transglutaminase-like putative cysteine protease
MKRCFISTLILLSLLVALPTCAADIPSGTLTFTLTPTTPDGADEIVLWEPYPMSDEFQTVSDMKVSGNYDESAIYRDPASESVYLYARWQKPAQAPSCVMQFHLSQKDRKKTNLKDSGASYPELVQDYLTATEDIPADDPEMQAIAKKIIKGKSGTLEKAQAVYDWVVENTFRDPEVKGCGIGNPLRTINQCQGGGKCADLSSVFVTLARAAGIPARDVYGLRLAAPKAGDVTSGFHCWAEFYLPGTGWVMVDPADVRKMMLVHHLGLKDAGNWRNFFWGGDDLFRLVLEKNARGANLIKSDSKLSYFMYPAAQIDGKMLNYFDADGFSYKVTFSPDN